MTIISFFSKYLKFDVHSGYSKKNQKNFLLLKIIAFESGSTNSLNLEKDTCHWQSTCYEKPLKLKISVREIFVKSGSLTVMEKK